MQNKIEREFLIILIRIQVFINYQKNSCLLKMNNENENFLHMKPDSFLISCYPNITMSQERYQGDECYDNNILNSITTKLITRSTKK